MKPTPEQEAKLKILLESNKDDVRYAQLLFEGDFKYWFWDKMDEIYGPSTGCMCSMREECRTCRMR